MSWESGKNALLNAVVSVGGIVAGTWLGRSETLQSLVERAAQTLAGRRERPSGSDTPKASESESPLRSIKEHLQRREGFRK